MVKITHAPWKEVIIHEVIELPFDEFINKHSVGVPTGGMAHPLLWAEGVVFNRAAAPPSPEMIKENLEGKVHLMGVEWAPMPEYRSIVEIHETKVRIPIVNVTATEILREVAKWLKQSAKSHRDE